jgi:hypothetical protein
MYAERMNRPSSVMPIILLIFVAVSFFLLLNNIVPIEQYVVEEMTLGVMEARIIEVVSGHAWQGHGLDVNEAFRCLNTYGSTKSFKTFGFTDFNNGNMIPTNLWMCFDPKTSRWYAVVTTYFEKLGADKIARLVTAYRVGPDIFKTVEDFVGYIVSKWGAVEIPYILGQGDILLRAK